MLISPNCNNPKISSKRNFENQKFLLVLKELTLKKKIINKLSQTKIKFYCRVEFSMERICPNGSYIATSKI